VLGTSDKTPNRDQERLLLEHIIYQANNLNNAYIFVISCINLAQVDHMKSSKSAQQVSQKLGEILKQFKVVIEGPLWYDIIQVANKKLLQLQEMVINRNFVRELKPLMTLAKALNWESIGSQMLSRVNLVSAVRVHGKKALKQKQVVNTFYRYAGLLKDQSITGALDLIEILLKFGDNHLAADFFPAYLSLAH
jgi:hypothetical protein